jgi:hypothetical protein
MISIMAMIANLILATLIGHPPSGWEPSIASTRIADGCRMRALPLVDSLQITGKTGGRVCGGWSGASWWDVS